MHTAPTSITGLRKHPRSRVWTKFLEKARKELRALKLDLPAAFAAWPGELVELRLAQNVGTGLWRVRESVSAQAEQGSYTRLTLAPPDVLG